MRNGIAQPQLDNFIQACALDTIYKYNPQLFLLHLTDVDTNRHLYGVESKEAKEALKRHEDVYKRQHLWRRCSISGTAFGSWNFRAEFGDENRQNPVVLLQTDKAVSYTHLDVYKRQG